MKISKIFKLGLRWLVLGLGLSTVQAVRGQIIYSNTGPLFQFAIFYDGLMEFTDCSPLTINGLVQCNSNIYVGCPSTSSTLTFNYPVTCSGIITNPAWFGYSQSYYITKNISYNGVPSPGYRIGTPAINMPLGSLSNSPNVYQQIINLPNTGDSPTNPLSLQRYYYKADLVILVTNVTTTNVSITVIVKSSMFDANPLTYSFTNNLPSNTAAWTNMTTNWNQFGAGYWLTTNAIFYDARQQQTNHVTQIDVGKFGTWIATNTNCLAKWNSTNPFNGVIYVADMRTTNGMYMDCVRLTNGQTIPTLGAGNSSPYGISGLTVATINPLYIAGLYNCPSNSNVGSTNTSGTAPCSVICDALTILSPAWQDGNSWAEATVGTIPGASASDTVNTAIIAGNVPSTGNAATTYSGGVHNLTRLLEDWSSSSLWLNTSLVNLFPSAQATRQFQTPGVYYNAPTRHFSFDLNFTSSIGLPPGTPLYVQVVTDSIILSNLVQNYNWSSLAPTVQTIPPGLNVNLEFEATNCIGTYFPVASNAGTYIVVATINDAVYSGVVSNTFTIVPLPATVTISNLVQTYDGTLKSVSITTTPSGLPIYMTCNGSTNFFDPYPTTHPIGVEAGSYPLVAEIGGGYSFAGIASNTFVILQAPAMVNLTNLSQTYDGSAKTVLATTSPAGLAVGLTYNGATNAPTNSGSYTVIATVNDANYQGSATNTLVIAPPAPGPITVNGTTTLADGTFQLSFTNTPGTTFTVMGSPDPTAPLTNWTVIGSVIEVSPGQFQFIDGNATNLAQEFYVVRSP